MTGIALPPPDHVAVAIVREESVPADVPLPPAETARAAAIRHAPTRDTFLAGRQLLRGVLSRVLAVPPSDVPVAIEPGGRPFVEGRADMAFSLSHAGGWVGLALARGDRVGLDIEDEAPPDADGVAEVIMGRPELLAYLAVPAPARPRAFLRAWTRKEALLKAAGTGFLVDPRDIPVMGFLGRHPDGRPYRLADLPTGPWESGSLGGPAAAVALPGSQGSMAAQPLGAGFLNLPW